MCGRGATHAAVPAFEQICRAGATGKGSRGERCCAHCGMAITGIAGWAGAVGGPIPATSGLPEAGGEGLAKHHHCRVEPRHRFPHGGAARPLARAPPSVVESLDRAHRRRSRHPGPPETIACVLLGHRQHRRTLRESPRPDPLFHRVPPRWPDSLGGQQAGVASRLRIGPPRNRCGCELLSGRLIPSLITPEGLKLIKA